MSTFDASSRFYLDAHSLDALRLQAAKDPKQALSAVSKQFESVLMSLMLKSMRDATPQDGIFDSEQTKMYTTMFDQQLVQTLSRKGMGLAEVMVRQLSRTEFHEPPAPQAFPGEASEPAEQAPSPHAGGFISRMLPYAREASLASGIPAKFMLGQAALETGWGQHEIRGANGRSSHNLFGIKAGADWKGPVVTAMTTEYVNGAPKKVYQNFRAYGSYAESFRDYAQMLKSNPRYADVAASGQDAAGFAQGLQSAGYATDPAYADKLMRIFGEASMQAAA